MFVQNVNDHHCLNHFDTCLLLNILQLCHISAIRTEVPNKGSIRIHTRKKVVTMENVYIISKQNLKDFNSVV